MNKLIVLSIVVGSFMYGNSYNNLDDLFCQSELQVKEYNWSVDTSEDDQKIEAGRRRGKGHKGRRRGGSGLR